MMRLENRYTAQKKYSREKTVSHGFSFLKEQDSLVIDKLNSVPNKAGYIKELIRKDIAREKGELNG